MQELWSFFEPGIVLLILVFLNYWLMNWIKRVLDGRLDDVFIQPLSLVTATLVSALVMFNYDYKPLNLGEARFEILGYLLQGLVVAALSGIMYEKYLRS